MPLPSNGSLSLRGHSGPGEAMQTKPKQAMLIRMSAETLDALSMGQPQMHFEFGTNPGIYIGDSFYPLRSRQENTPHDLYLRASTLSRPMPPLKLYASVTGKFTVERDLSKVTSQLHESAQDAAKERPTRTTIRLNSPPPGVAAATTKQQKKSKSSTFIRGAKRAANKNGSIFNHPPPSVPPRVASPIPRSSPRPSPRPMTKDLVPLRKRLVHCLAVAERTTEEVLRLVMGSDADSNAQQVLLGLLGEVADPTPKNLAKSSKWRLKAESWLDIRPNEWPQLTEAERTSMIHQARQAFAALRIPDADPAWEHIRLRPSSKPVNGTSSMSRVASQNSQAASDIPPPPKRTAPLDSKRKSRPKPSSGDISLKDERLASTFSSTNGDAKDDVRPSPSLPTKLPPTASSRRPGSGFKLPRHSSHDGQSDAAESPVLPPAAKLKAKPVDPRRKDREAVPSLPTKSAPSILPPERERKLNGSMQPSQRAKREPVASETERGQPRSDVDRVRGRGRDFERDRERDSDRDMDVAGPSRHAWEKDKQRIKVESVTLKRKKPPRDLDEQEYMPSRSSSIKRQKVDASDRPASSSREESVVRKIPTQIKTEPITDSPQARPAIKRELSPELRSRRDVPPPRRQTEQLTAKSFAVSRPIKRRTSPPPSPSGHQRSMSSKSRRRSPVFTSSEDEVDGVSLKPGPATLPTPPKTTRPTHHSSQVNSRLTPNHASLRLRYKSAYCRYLATFQKIVAQQTKIESMLNGDGNSGSDTDSDVELMDADDLAKLVSEHRKQQDELEDIQREFSRPAST